MVFVVSAFTIIFGACAAARGEIYVFPSWMKVKFNNKPKKDKQPNILLEYIKAKKQKICPLIELED